MKNKKGNLLTKERNLSEILLKVSIAMLIAVIFIVCFMQFGGMQFLQTVTYVSAYTNYEFQLHAIDVENGDAFLIKLPDNKVLMIDCGEEKYQDRVVSYISQFMQRENLLQIDYFVLTHSDSDHVGNAKAVIENFNVVNLYRPKKYSLDEHKFIEINQQYLVDDGALYNRAITAAYNHKCNIIFNESGIEITFKNGSIEFLSPNLNVYDEDNDYSAVMMIEYYGTKMLFMGDASVEIETQLIETYGAKLQADILKVGHHGSTTSTSEEFVNAVKPKYAILSCSDNSGVLPNVDVVKLLQDKNITCLSTMHMQNFALTIQENMVLYSPQQDLFNFWPILLTVVFVMVVVMFKVPFSKYKQAK